MANKKTQRTDREISLRDVEVQRHLLYCGVQRMVLGQPAIDLKNALGRIEATTTTGKPKVLKVDQQIEKLERVLEDPLASPYVMCISSTQTDLKAKYLAAFVMYQAVKLYNIRERLEGKIGLPQWHVLTGSYQDKYRDRAPKGVSRPAMLVLTNVVDNSSEVKTEKLRDLLEIYSDIPRIVTITGEDPVTYFAQHLKYPLHVPLFLTSGGKVVKVKRGTSKGARKVTAHGGSVQEI